MEITREVKTKYIHGIYDEFTKEILKAEDFDDALVSAYQKKGYTYCHSQKAFKKVSVGKVKAQESKIIAKDEDGNFLNPSEYGSRQSMLRQSMLQLKNMMEG